MFCSLASADDIAGVQSVSPSQSLCYGTRGLYVHLQSSCSSPVNHLGDKGRLVAVGHAVDNARLLCFASEQRTGKDIGLDIDHDYVFFMLATLHRIWSTGKSDGSVQSENEIVGAHKKCVLDTSGRVSSHLKDHINLRRGN